MTTGKQKSLNPSRKTRARIGKKPAKISEYESDKGASSDDKEDFKLSSVDCGNSEMADSRTRARLRNKPVEINEDESDEAAAVEEHTTNESFKLSGRDPGQVSDLQKTEAQKDSMSERGKAIEQEVTELSNYRQQFDEVNESGIGQGSRSQQEDRLEDNDDPVQAMLLNMVPFLAAKKVEPVREEVKTRAPDCSHEEEKLPNDAEMQPVKKRKVSYKDMVDELLKDW